MSLILLFEGVKFDPLKLGYENPDKRKMAEAVVKMLKKTIELSIKCYLGEKYRCSFVKKIIWQWYRVNRSKKETFAWKSL